MSHQIDKVSHNMKLESQLPTTNTNIKQTESGKLLKLVLLFIFSGVLYLLTNVNVSLYSLFSTENDPYKVALKVLKKAPVLDTHLDLPIFLREEFGLDFDSFNLSKPIPSPFPLHIDFERTRIGRLGGGSFSSFVECPSNSSTDTSVRDTIEQLDTVHLIEEYYDYVKIIKSSKDLEKLPKNNLGIFLSLEGAHQLGNSLGTLRMYARMGVKYVTLAHNCDNIFADSSVGSQNTNNGLSNIGKSLVKEMNRVGILVDLSHTSDSTAHQAIDISDGPLFWSHSGSREIFDHPRNVPDDLLIRLRDSPNDGIIQIVFAPDFIAGETASVVDVSNHIEHVAQIVGKQHVGIGSDFDGIPNTPEGLEDISKYPNLFAELYSRGTWTEEELEGLARNNFIRILKKTEQVARKLQKTIEPSMDVWEGRHDLLNGRKRN